MGGGLSAAVPAQRCYPSRPPRPGFNAFWPLLDMVDGCFPGHGGHSFLLFHETIFLRITSRRWGILTLFISLLPILDKERIVFCPLSLLCFTFIIGVGIDD